MSEHVRTAVVIPIGPGKETALDTLESVACYCAEPHLVVLVDDCTADGTYEALLLNKRPNWHILRNSRPLGRLRLVQTLCSAFRFIACQSHCDLVLRLDQDALIIKHGILTDALEFSRANPSVGLFGVYERDYNRPRSFDSHQRLISAELGWLRALLGLRPPWARLLRLAESRGYRRGDNVFGGAYFITHTCLAALQEVGALNVPYDWHSRLMEDVYFSMAAVAAGFELGHFAAPDGPLCLEWNGLPYPAEQLAKSHYKLVHSVDKGENTDRNANEGKTAREFFRGIRRTATPSYRI
jgi:hypothetical protein